MLQYNKNKMPDETEILAQLHHVAVKIGERAILSHADLTLRRREIVTLIGPNGAGKTTMLRVLIGLIAPTSGTVTRAPNLRIGYMPQKLALNPALPLSVRRFLTLWHPQIETALTEVKAAHLADRSLHTLSGGELQRILLARALLGNPDLLVLDEPVAGVDVQGQTELYSLIGKIRDTRGCAILLVSHDLHLVMAHTDRVVCLNSHICCEGKPEDVGKSPEYLSLFGPAFAVYHHHHDHHHD